MDVITRDFFAASLSLVGDMVSVLREASSVEDIRLAIEAASDEMGFRFWALIHHDDLRCE